MIPDGRGWTGSSTGTTGQAEASLESIHRQGRNYLTALRELSSGSYATFTRQAREPRSRPWPGSTS